MSLLNKILFRLGFYKEEISNVNQIIFSIDENNHCWVDLRLNHLNIQAGETFAQLLFNLNNGKYKTAIIDNLISLAKDNPELQPYVDSIIIYWGILISATDNDETGNKPLISPKNVFLGKDK